MTQDFNKEKPMQNRLMTSTGTRDQRGQTTAEYALVLVAAATIATLLLTWASSTRRVASLFDLVFRSVSGMLA
jgi:Flp pilus assembly pilin Flp